MVITHYSFISSILEEKDLNTRWLIQVDGSILISIHKNIKI